MRISLLLALLITLQGCYTQLMTRSSADFEGRPAADTVVVRHEGGTVGCNCTAWEIRTGMCWCTCDRCGHYHRFGYRFCPGGWYRSYWGWDYYYDYPWWYDRYRHRYHQPHYHGYDHGTGSGGSASEPSYAPRPSVRDRKTHRKIINTAPEPSSKSKVSGGASSSSQTVNKPATPPKNRQVMPDSVKTRLRNKKRMR